MKKNTFLKNDKNHKNKKIPLINTADKSFHFIIIKPNKSLCIPKFYNYFITIPNQQLFFNIKVCKLTYCEN